MERKLKIVAIGGGSSYTPELVDGLIVRNKELPVGEICLVDVEEGKERLDIIVALSKRMIEKANLDIKITSTLNRREALVGADFVTTQFRVGQLEARRTDEHIPLKYNTIGQETNGPGGLMKGLRTIPIILEICKEIEELCPNAWLINFTNPSGMITEAIFRHSTIKKAIGLCNGPFKMEMDIARLLEVDQSRIFVEFTGLNHMVFAKNIYLDGENVTAKVVEKYAKQNDYVSLQNITDLTWDYDFMTQLGVIPIGYLRYYLKKKEMLESNQYGFEHEGTRSEVVMRVEKELFEIYKDKNTDEKPPQLMKRGGAYYSEVACRLICSLYNDSRDIQTVNVRNNGAIAGIDENSAVEVNCVITKQGPIPLTTGHLPVPLKGLIHQIKTFEQIASDAAVTGDRKLALLALTLNPLVDSDVDAHKMLDEMLEVNKKYLPNFFK